MAKIISRDCSFTDLRPELQEMIKDYLSSDDKPLICCETTDGSLFLSYVVTQHRIVDAESWHHGFFEQVAGSKARDTSVRSMLLRDVISTTEQDNGKDEGFYVYVAGHGHDNIHCKFESRQASFNFTNILRKATEQTKAAASQSRTFPDIADQLAKLAKLYLEDKVLTREEYEAAKKKLLG